MVDIDEDETLSGESSQNAATHGVSGSEVRAGVRLEQGQGEAPASKPISADMQQFIGRQLRAVYDDVAKQPVPDRFLELMKQLDGKTQRR